MAGCGAISKRRNAHGPPHRGQPRGRTLDPGDVAGLPWAAFRLECEERLTAGLERLARGGVDVLLLDLSLPETQGLDTLRRVRSQAPGVPVVVLTGSDDEELGNRAVQSGAQDYLIKGQVDGPLLGRPFVTPSSAAGSRRNSASRAEQLAEMDRRKDEFLATLAHELRNPLAPIRNPLQILRLSGGSGPVAEHVHEMMERQVSHMVRLVDDLLEVSRITRGKIELRKERVELAAVVRERRGDEPAADRGRPATG